ncbi:unnamed protein product [Dicrocoelium dendriticum]|nr:unnamed protein product [Dicrocoelium dendriticum]
MAFHTDEADVLMETDFRNNFVGRLFDSFDSFYSHFTAFMHRNNVNFVCFSSKKCNVSKVKYDRILYKCVRHKPRHSRSQGIRRVFSRGTNCSARVNVARVGRKLKVLSFHLAHNHPCNRFLYERHPLNRRLTEDEFNQSADLFRYNTPTRDVILYIENAFGKRVTSDHVRNLRRRLRSPVSFNMRQANQTMEQDGGQTKPPLGCARNQQVEMSLRSPHVCVDAAHGTNRPSANITISSTPLTSPAYDDITNGFAAVPCCSYGSLSDNTSSSRVKPKITVISASVVKPVCKASFE